MPDARSEHKKAAALPTSSILTLRFNAELSAAWSKSFPKPFIPLAASGIKGFGKLLDYAAESSALKRNVSIKEVGNTAAFLCSDLASGITGEVTYVDAGYNFYEKGPDL